MLASFSKNTPFDLVAHQIEPNTLYLAPMIRHYSQDLAAAVWLAGNRRGRAHDVEFLREKLNESTVAAESELRSYFNLPPYSSALFSLLEASQTDAPFKQARWLLAKWVTPDGNVRPGRGKLCPGELHPKTLVVVLTLAVLAHSERQAMCNREIIEVARGIYQAAVGKEKTWHAEPYEAWKKYLHAARREIDRPRLGGLYLLWLRLFDQVREGGRPPFSVFDLK